VFSSCRHAILATRSESDLSHSSTPSLANHRRASPNDRSSRFSGPPLPDISSIRILRITEQPEADALKNLSGSIGFA
jgi:hypothetical protein